jgi:hypothetical protein
MQWKKNRFFFYAKVKSIQVMQHTIYFHLFYVKNINIVKLMNSLAMNSLANEIQIQMKLVMMATW